MHTCFDAPNLSTPKFVYEWAERQTELSLKFMNDGKGMSSTSEGRKQKREMMNELDFAFRKRASAELHADYLTTYRTMFLKHLEDPGTFENFRFFDVPNSDEMIMFYISIWTGKMGDAMLYLHFYGKDLKGNYRFSPEDESWRKMAENEGIAINERIKAQSVANQIKTLKAKNICFFGGGSLPERLYDDCLSGTNVVLFETGPVDMRSILNCPSRRSAPLNLRIFKDSLLNARNYPRFFESQDLVVMHGVSMYLGKQSRNMAAALENAGFLLRHGGVMMFDYLLMTKGMMRTATAQHWPGAKDMLIFKTPAEALEETRRVVKLANRDDWMFYIDSFKTTENGRWGPTSVRIVLEKE